MDTIRCLSGNPYDLSGAALVMAVGVEKMCGEVRRLGTEPDTGAGTGEPPRLRLGRGWGCDSVRGGGRQEEQTSGRC